MHNVNRPSLQVGSSSRLLEVRENEDSRNKQIRRKVPFVPKDAAEVNTDLMHWVLFVDQMCLGIQVEACTIYVENVPRGANNDDLRAHFAKFGDVSYVSLPRFKNGTVKGFAFVEFNTSATAEAALSSYGFQTDQKVEKDPEELRSIQTYHQEQKEKLDEEESNEKDEKKNAEGQKDQTNSEDKTKEDENVNEKGDASKEDEGASKKKNKRKRGPRGHSAPVRTEFDASDLESLTVMSRSSWKKLRNTYLDQQRKNMSQAKMRLKKWQEKNETQQQHPPEHQQPASAKETATNNKDNNKRMLELVPGTIVKFETKESIGDRELLKKKVKSAFLDGGGVHYIDISHGACSFHVRCVTEEHAKKLSKVVGLAGEGGSAKVLTGEEEKTYWAKAQEDRRQKLESKTASSRGRKDKGASSARQEGNDVAESKKRFKRGREKLSGKLDERGSHKYFTDDE